MFYTGLRLSLYRDNMIFRRLFITPYWQVEKYFTQEVEIKSLLVFTNRLFCYFSISVSSKNQAALLNATADIRRFVLQMYLFVFIY
jgi:hypothetical protein